jgi:hypothetical protein
VGEVLLDRLDRCEQRVGDRRVAEPLQDEVDDPLLGLGKEFRTCQYGWRMLARRSKTDCSAD